MTTRRFTPAYPAELRERGVRLFRDNRADYTSGSAAYRAIAPKLGCSPDSLRVRCQQAERGVGQRAGPTSAEKDRIEELEREVRELRTANEILKKATVHKTGSMPLIRSLRPAAAAPTVADLWAEYRDWLGDQPTGRTMVWTGKAILPHFGHLNPDRITVETCRSFAARRAAEGRHAGAIWTELGHLRSCLSWAWEKARRIDHHIFIELPQKPAPKDRYLTHAEIAPLLEAARSSDPHVRLAIVMLLGTAARVGAILDLPWDRVDMARGLIDLRVDPDRPRKGRAVLPMNPMLRAALSVAREAALSDHVIEYGGRPVGSIRGGFMRAVTRSGLDGVHMAGAGIDMERIAQIFGHNSAAVTRRIYARFAPEHLADAAAVLDFSRPRQVQ